MMLTEMTPRSDDTLFRVVYRYRYRYSITTMTEACQLCMRRWRRDDLDVSESAADDGVSKIAIEATSGECALNVNQRRQRRQWICQWRMRYSALEGE